MERRPGPDDRFTVLPQHALPCVWMTAGLLSYRLCDRNYECERCPLDAAIRGVELPPRADPVEAGPPASAWGIRDDRRHDPAYGWVAEAGEGRLRWGLDGLTARLLDRLSSVVLPAVGTQLVRGQAACWLMDDGELVPLRAPVSATVIATNHAVQRDPGLITSSPYEDGWLVELRSRCAIGALPGLCDAASRTESAARQVARLHRAALRYLHADPGVGPTAQDGGQRITDLRHSLGTRRYHELVLNVLR